MAFSSPIDFADRSADYWKRQLTLEETEKNSLLGKFVEWYWFLLMRLRNYADSFGKGVGLRKRVALGLSLISC